MFVILPHFFSLRQSFCTARLLTSKFDSLLTKISTGRLVKCIVLLSSRLLADFIWGTIFHELRLLENTSHAHAIIPSYIHFHPRWILESVLIFLEEQVRSEGAQHFPNEVTCKADPDGETLE
jgi:hypothetical protein